MECKVTLKDESGNVFKSSGELSVLKNGFKLEYSLDGDKCIIEGGEREITQIRRGSLNTEMVFVQGVRTRCILSDGDLHGEIPVYTQKIAYLDGEYGIKIGLEYLLGGESKMLSLKALKNTK